MENLLKEISVNDLADDITFETRQDLVKKIFSSCEDEYEVRSMLEPLAKYFVDCANEDRLDNGRKCAELVVAVQKAILE